MNWFGDGLGCWECCLVLLVLWVWLFWIGFFGWEERRYIMCKFIIIIFVGFFVLFVFILLVDVVLVDGKCVVVWFVCEMGYWGMLEYDCKCLKCGIVMDGVNLWFCYIDINKMVLVKEWKFLCWEVMVMGMGM